MRFRYSARVQKLMKFISGCWASHISFILFNSTISNEMHLSIPSVNVRAHRVCVSLLLLLCLQNFNAALSAGSLHMYGVERWTCFLHLPPLGPHIQEHFPPRNCEVTSTYLMNTSHTQVRSRQCHVCYGASFILRLKTPISNSISSQLFSQGCEVHLSLSHELNMCFITASAVSSNTLRNPNMSSLHGKLLKNDLGGRSAALYGNL